MNTDARRCFLRMPVLRAALIVVWAGLLISCSKPEPSHPKAGLSINDGSAMCRFWSPPEQTGPLHVQFKTNAANYKQDGHEVILEWQPNYGKSEDEYHFVIQLDGAMQRKTISYAGKPITLMREPFKIVVQDIDL